MIFILFFLGSYAIISFSTGIWLLFIARKVRITSNLMTFLTLGSWGVFIKSLFLKPSDIYLNVKIQRIIGIIFIITSFLCSYAFFLIKDLF
jgi:hypothetical protein